MAVVIDHGVDSQKTSQSIVFYGTLMPKTPHNKGINTPATKPSTDSEDEWKNYITTMGEYWTGKVDLYNKKVKDCFFYQYR